jgi:hypothetical protein
MHSTTYKKQGAPDRRSPTQQKLRLFYMRSTTYKKQWTLNRRSLTQQKLMLSTRVAPRTKSKGALDRRSTHLLLLSACTSLCTKRKGLHRYVLQIYYFINQFFKSFCSSVGIIIDGLVLP